MLWWLALAAVISVAFSEKAAEISKMSDAAVEVAGAAPEVAQEAAESHYPNYGHRHEERERHHGYRHHEPRRHELHEPHRHESHEPRRHESHEPRRHESHEPRRHESHEPRRHESHEPRRHESHEPRRHESHEPHRHESHEPHHHDSHEPRRHESHEPHRHESHEPRHHDSHEPRRHESHEPHRHESHKPRHQGPKDHHETHERVEPHRLEPEEHRGPSVAKVFDPHHMVHHTPQGVRIIEDVFSPDYIQPTWFLDYRYLKTGNRDYAIADGGQIMILPEHVQNHEHKEFGSFDELLEFSRLKKLAEKNAHLLHPEKGHGLGYMRSHEDRMEQMRGRMVHEHERHRELMRGRHEH